MVTYNNLHDSDAERTARTRLSAIGLRGRIHPRLLFLIVVSMVLPQVFASYASLAGATNTDWFQPLPTSMMEPSDALDVQYSVGNESGTFNVAQWAARGMRVRSGGDDLFCLGNLTWALRNIHELNIAEYSGAAGTLALLPTAGALIGAPTKELWLIHKLIPIAGLLTIFLSLGGTIMPSSAEDYDLENMSYGGMIATRKRMQGKHDAQKLSGLDDAQDRAERLANRVAIRAQDTRGGRKYWKLWISVIVQFVFLVAIAIVLWYGQQGAIIPWWCRVWGWMYFWFFLVSAVAIAENYSSTPFRRSWTLRVSRAPSNVRISKDTPDLASYRLEGEEGNNRNQDQQHDILQLLKDGFDITSKVILSSDDPYSKPKSCFYVVISQVGISPIHAAGKVFSKASGLAVYAFGTALFAACQLMSISAALMILSITLGCAGFGRMNGMLIAAEMNDPNESILHSIVHTEEEAAAAIESILRKRDLLIELEGYIILNGHVLHRRTPWLDPATYVGLLAAPFNLERIAINRSNQTIHHQASNIHINDSKSALDQMQRIELLSASAI